MGWWSVVKSSRREAYEEFINEFGPEVELDSLRLNAHDDTNQVQIDSPDSEWVVNYAILSSGEEQFTFESMSKYGASSQIFVEGMFETEYPERYQELLEMAKGALPQDAPLPLIGKYYLVFRDVMKFLRERIRHHYGPNSDYNRRAKPLMLSATSRLYLDESEDAERLHKN